MNGLPFRCPPGTSPRKWAGWNAEQRRRALKVYWWSLSPDTRRMLGRKYAEGGTYAKGKLMPGPEATP